MRLDKMPPLRNHDPSWVIYRFLGWIKGGADPAKKKRRKQRQRSQRRNRA